MTDRLHTAETDNGHVRRMLVSHERALAGAKLSGEPAGQLASRELEVARIRAALRRAEELAGDVATAIESAGDLLPASPASVTLLANPPQHSR